MNRRGFLQRFGLGFAAAVALAHVPVSVVEALSTPEAARLLACEYLRRRFNDYQRIYKRPPLRMDVAPGLFAAYEAELATCQRFTSSASGGGRSLMFKSVPMREVAAMTGWNVHLPAPA